MLFFIIQLSAQGQLVSLLQPHLEPFRASKKIKTIRQFGSEGIRKKNTKFKLLTEANFNAQGKLLRNCRYIPELGSWYHYHGKETQLYEYDDKGRVITYIQKVEYPNPKVSRTLYYLRYKYHDLENTTTIYYCDPDGSFYRKADDSGDSTATLQYAEQASSALTSNQNSQVIQDTLQNQYVIKEYSHKQKLTYEKIIQLNKENQITQIKHIYYPGKITEITHIRYDPNGNEIERIELNRSGKIRNRYFNTFNPEGLLLHTTWTGPKDVLIQIIKYEYAFFE
ncbi:hypothetical protein AHMF7616_02252 [Adhaeribacter pallidiroseus]|uniref:Uncharacterized protein n=2 Tax=Adhaeribacter pallidiroseus TaxID=2072847 RepID=A0A369QK74_9BACT|nr:hypothetical protein AHMF7616_02252 [Adhaeribacter pallidiroseus]